jgi:hypothetical protein
MSNERPTPTIGKVVVSGPLGRFGTSKMFAGLVTPAAGIAALGQASTIKAFAGLRIPGTGMTLADSLTANPVVVPASHTARPPATTAADATSIGSESTNIGNGRRLTLRESVELIAAALGAELGAVMILSWPELVDAIDAVITFGAAFVVFAAVVIRFVQRWF